MSTVIRLIPRADAAKETTGIAILDDGRIRTRVETASARTDKEFNFGSLVEGDTRDIPDTDEPVTRVNAEKIGTDARFVIDVIEFYDENLRGADAPKERFLWYLYTLKPEEAPAPDAPQTATPSTPLWVLWSSDGTPAAPTNAFSFGTAVTAPRLYAELQNDGNRREYLKSKLLMKIADPIELLSIFAGTAMNTIASYSFTQPASNSRLHIVRLEHERALQSWVFRLEMLARAISADVNLNSEQKFNLLNGEIGLSNVDIFGRVDKSLAGLINQGGGNRNAWVFHRLGSVAGTAPFAYTPPPQNTSVWSSTADTSINVTSEPPSEVLDWINWLRN